MFDDLSVEKIMDWAFLLDSMIKVSQNLLYFCYRIYFTILEFFLGRFYSLKSDFVYFIASSPFFFYFSMFINLYSLYSSRNISNFILFIHT